MIDLDDLQQVRQMDRLGLQAIAADSYLPEQALCAAAARDSITYAAEVSGLAHLAVALNTLSSPTSRALVLATGDMQPDLTFDTHPAYTLAFFLALFVQSAGVSQVQPAVDHAWLRSLLPETPAVDNVAKQMALRLYQHIPLIWSGEAWLKGVGEDWRLRILYYAESAALVAGSEAMQRMWSMARFPNFWPKGVAVVHLGQVGASATPADSTLATILAARRFPRLELTAPGTTRIATALHYLYLGNWIALYLAALYQVDPADRVPLQLLGLT